MGYYRRRNPNTGEDEVYFFDGIPVTNDEAVPAPSIVTGEPGPKGDKGDPGDAGPSGTPGADGAQRVRPARIQPSLARLALPATTGSKEIRGRKESKASKASKARPATPARKGRRVLLARTPRFPDRPEMMGQRDRRANKGFKGSRGSKARRGVTERRGYRGIPAHLGMTGLPPGADGATGPQGPSGVPFRMTFATPVLAALAWTNMPAALSFLFSSATVGKEIQKADLTNYTQCRLLVNKQGTAGAAASKLILRYRTAFNQVVANYSDIGASEVSVAVNVTNSYLDTGWINLVAGAKADVFVSVLGSGGDGALDPAFGPIVAEFR